ncbi:MAG: XrtN system VIT domain-containing protein [Chitinophagales bacterium]
METIETTTEQVETREKSFPGALYGFGILCVAVSCAVFLGFGRWSRQMGADWCFINYIIFVVLLLASLISGALSFFGFTKPYKNVLVFPLMVAGTISCFALNQEINVFYTSTQWLTILLIVVNITVLLIPFLRNLPLFLQRIAFAILGVAWLLYLYFSVILVTLYPAGFIGIIAIGLGIHAFVPLICLIALSSFFNYEFNRNNKMLYYAIAVIAILFVSIFTFMVRWHKRSVDINNIKQEMNLNAPGDLPDWAIIAQKIPADDLSKKVLLSDVMYTTGDLFFERGFDLGLNGMNADEERVHDPLITLASMFTEKIDLADDEIIKVMETAYDIRHLTESRLWTGRDLTSKTVTSNVRIYPNERLAYTEKIITVENKSEYTWQNRQEAIYSFYLPEGATVSSLSLWINGVEEKGYLTTKGKAQNAYSTIVGKEQRDPSVVHWQEGNRVSVRIFPCTTNEPRQFKIGISSPLKLVGDRLYYNNIYFKGPDATNAREIIQVNYTDKPDDLKQPDYLDKSSGINTYKAKHTYEPDWTLSFKAKPIKENHFVYKNKKYSIAEAKEIKSNKQFNTYYLDVNKNWTNDEWNQLIQQLKDKEVKVFLDKIIKVNADNADDIFETLQQNNYNVFPFYKIPENEEALVITKSGGLSPNLNELKETPFYTKLTEKIVAQKNKELVDLGENTTPYLKTLAEFRAIHLQHKSLDEIVKLIQSNSWTENPETGNTVYIPSAKISITEETTMDSTSNASNHNFRLYGYNTVLKQLNTAYYMDDTITDAAIEMAANANVVTPLSSLVVLEKQEDYDRFDIKKSKDGIGNASMHSDGSVPEPHEWALIIALSLFILHALKNKRYAAVA